MPALRWIDGESDAEELLELLDGDARPPGLDQQTARAEWFLAGLAGLGLRRAGDPPDAAFLDDSAARLGSVWAGVLALRDGVRRLLRDRFWADEWIQACERRTALQFLADWYAGGPLADRLPELELDDVDEDLRHRGASEGFLPAGEIPDGVPESHWWWRFP